MLRIENHGSAKLASLVDVFRPKPLPDIEQLIAELQAGTTPLSERAIAPAQQYASDHGPVALLHKWRGDAKVLKRRGAVREAEVLGGVADELEAALEAHRLAELTLDAAADESGYTRRGLEKMIERGDLANTGRDGAPRVRRCDLPRKPTAPKPHVVDVTSILERRRRA